MMMMTIAVSVTHQIYKRLRMSLRIYGKTLPNL